MLTRKPESVAAHGMILVKRFKKSEKNVFAFFRLFFYNLLTNSSLCDIIIRSTANADDFAENA